MLSPLGRDMGRTRNKRPIDKCTVKTLRHHFCQTAAAFHRVSSFGRFPEPEAPYLINDKVSDEDVGHEGLAAFLSTEQRPPIDFWLALETRTSSRSFHDKPLPEKMLRTLLHAAYGKKSAINGSRVVPSAGALYPLTVFVLARAVEGICQGIYRLTPVDTLAIVDRLYPDDLQPWFRTTHVDYKKVAAIVFFSGRWDRMCPKYGARGYRYLLLEAGHAAQNMCLVCAGLDIPHLTVGGFEDDMVNTALKLAEDEEGVIYSVVIGQM